MSFWRRGEKRADTVLSEYLDGVLPAGERANLERRLEEEPALRTEVVELSAVRSMVASLPKPRPERSFALSEEMLGRAAGPHPARPAVWRYAGAAVAGLALFVAGSLATGTDNGNGTYTVSADHEAASAQRAAGAESGSAPPAALDAAAEDDGPRGAAVPAPGSEPAKSAGESGDAGPSAELAGDDDAGQAGRWLQVAGVLVALVAVAAWSAAFMRQRRSEK